jgi:diguanylate cyclase (GGDEF)-like protein/PAS domain S-box-containing protein
MSLHAHTGSPDALDLSAFDMLSGLDALGVSVTVADLAGTILVWSDSSVAMFGWSAEEVLGRRAWDITDWGVRQSDVAQLLSTAVGQPWSGESHVVAANGETVRVRISASLVGQSPQLVVWLASRMDLPGGDALTGLATRSQFMGLLEALPAGPAAVLFVDIDAFRLVNDNRGHAAGDALLVAAAQRLRATCRPGDTVGRFGDDEFVLLCPGAKPDEACRLAEDIQRSFEEPLESKEGPIPVSVSIGVATTDEVAAGELIQSAGRALTHAKSSGRGGVELHDRTMRGSTAGRLQLLTDLRAAIKEGGLAVHYQPVVHTDGRFVGVEALLRWHHPQHGDVSPSYLIPLAESNGLMPALGAWILDRACSDIAHHPDPAVAGLHVAVNLSTRQLADPAIVPTVSAALRRSGLPADRLVLEVTETSVIANPETTSRQLQALKALGVRVALDDFGTGYSSLDYVRRFPVDLIKIDRSFVAGMETRSQDLAIVASVINLAATLGVHVVAEGVETAEQAEILRRLGCTYMQGFYWSRAVPIEHLAMLLPHPSSVGRGRGARQAQATHSDYENAGRILALRRAGASPTTIAAALNGDGRRTPQGSRWHAASVARTLMENEASSRFIAGA